GGMAVPAPAAGSRCLPAALAVVVVPPVMVAVVVMPTVAPVAVITVAPVTVVVACITAGPFSVAAGAEDGVDHRLTVPAARRAAAVHDRGLPSPLVDVDYDAPVRGRQRDLPHRAVVQVIGLDLDDPAVRNLGLGDARRLGPGDVLVHRHHGRGRAGRLVSRG